MKSFNVSEKHSGKKLMRVISSHFKQLPSGSLQRAFRQKDVRVNGQRIARDQIVFEGDNIEVYISDEILAGGSSGGNTAEKPFEPVYEDENIIVVNKSQGLSVQQDRGQSNETLIDLVRSYLSEETGRPLNDSSFSPSLCHRIDRNTGGLIIIAKNRESHEIMVDKIKNQEVIKSYQCMVKGKMPKNSDVLKAYLFKDEKKSTVYVKDRPSRGASEIITKYKVLSADKEMSRLEVELVTGRTHQIRAHLAFVGHPIVGDGKYGDNSFNRLHKTKYQALWAFKLRFDFKSNAGILNYLNKKELEVEPSFKIS